MPSLYYESNEIFRENSIEAKFYLDPNFPNNNLDVFALVYTLNGTLLGEYPAYEGILEIRENIKIYQKMYAQIYTHIHTYIA